MCLCVRFNGVGEFFLNVVWLNLQILFFCCGGGDYSYRGTPQSKRRKKWKNGLFFPSTLQFH